MVPVLSTRTLRRHISLQGEPCEGAGDAGEKAEGAAGRAAPRVAGDGLHGLPLEESGELQLSEELQPFRWWLNGVEPPRSF